MSGSPAEGRLVSVLMPTFNAVPYLPAAIDSVLSQTHRNLELLVADDGSTDSSRAILDAANDPRVRRLHNPQRLGYLRTTNRLFAAARGDYVAFQDADDLSDPRRFQLQVELLQREPRLGLCGTWAALIDAQDRVLAIDERPTEPDEIRKRMYSRNPFCGATIMVRRPVLVEVGGYREEFEGYSHQDYDWACRLLEAHEARTIALPLYSYRQHSASNSKQVTVGRAVGDQLARALAEQRRTSGTDVIKAGDTEGLQKLTRDLSRPYLEDPAMLDRVFASRFLWGGFPGWAVRRAWAAVLKSPWDLENYRVLQYCARQALRSRAGRRGAK